MKGFRKKKDGEFKNQVKPWLQSFVDQLLEEFEKEKIIVRVSTGTEDRSYKLAVTTESDGKTNLAKQKNIFDELRKLRDIARAVFTYLRVQDSNNNNYTPSQVITRLHDLGAINAPWIKQQEVIQIFNSLDNLTDPENMAEIEGIIENHHITVNRSIISMLEFYGCYFAKKYFSEYQYIVSATDKRFDLMLSHRDKKFSDLIFEFKYRSGNALPNREIILT